MIFYRRLISVTAYSVAAHVVWEEGSEGSQDGRPAGEMSGSSCMSMIEGADMDEREGENMVKEES
jgi:hypothetical protein